MTYEQWRDAYWKFGRVFDEFRSRRAWDMARADLEEDIAELNTEIAELNESVNRLARTFPVLRHRIDGLDREVRD